MKLALAVKVTERRFSETPSGTKVLLLGYNHAVERIHLGELVLLVPRDATDQATRGGPIVPGVPRHPSVRDTLGNRAPRKHPNAGIEYQGVAALTIAKKQPRTGAAGCRRGAAGCRRGAAGRKRDKLGAVGRKPAAPRHDARATPRKGFPNGKQRWKLNRLDSFAVATGRLDRELQMGARSRIRVQPKKESHARPRDHELRQPDLHPEPVETRNAPRDAPNEINQDAVPAASPGFAQRSERRRPRQVLIVACITT